MKISERTYPAKLLLFGEHTVLIGSSSLAIPLRKYGMRWVRRYRGHPSWFRSYLDYLKINCQDFLDIPALNDWVAQYTIEADIPIGYGLGSSGALTAAIFDVCGIQKDNIPLSELQIQLGKMESFFHGSSSGFDPLISYSNKPILKENNKIRYIDSDEISVDLNCYLLDSKGARSGKDMISKFIETRDLNKEDVIKLSDLNDMAISIVLGPYQADLVDIIKRISQLQLDIMEYMIIPDLIYWWKEGLKNNGYFIKICGAGGGGYYLVFSLHRLEKVGPFLLEDVDL